MAVITSLVEYWPLDEASGNALGVHGGNDLTETSGTIAATTGKVSGCRDFELGDTEYFERADNAALSTGDIDFTIAFWVNHESLGTVQALVTKWAGSAGSDEYGVYFNPNRFQFYVVSAGSVQSFVTADNFGAPSTATWYFVVATHDSVNNLLGISVNAGTANTAAHSAGVRDGTRAFRLGAQDAGSPVHMDGLLDEVGFWKKVLSPTEITWLYNSGNGRSYADIVAEAGGVSVVPVLMRQYRMRRAA